MQKAGDHLIGHGCPKCGTILISKKLLNTTKSFIEKAINKHGSKYDYSKVKYVDCKTEIIIACPKHGDFTQKPFKHIAGRICPQCAKENTSDSASHSLESFINKANKIHKNKYDYSKTNYLDNTTEITIVCKEHGSFKQTPKNHIQGCGCQKCGSSVIISSGHQEIIDFIKSISDTEVTVNDREIIKPHELDIYLPEHNFAIEYNGLYWHSYSQNETSEERKKHQFKHQLCLNNNIKLFQIFENEWLDLRTKEILKSKIKIVLGLGSKIHARKCIIKDLNNKEYSNFMNKNHLQGSKGASIKLGLFHQDNLISVISFNKHPKHKWEITRFANKLDIVVVGGASKLFKHFVRKHNPQQILTYADRRYSDGDLYKKLGFKQDGITQPNYFYVKSGNLLSRQQFQKHKLKRKLNQFNPILIESQNMFNNGYRRIWDAGHFRFVMI